MLMDGVLVGAALTDNAYQDDGYRFHDVFHIAFTAILGWSPVLRLGGGAFLRQIDVVEGALWPD